MSDHKEPARLLTVRDVARFTRLSESHIRYLASSGELVSLQLGRRKGLRFLHDDLLEFIKRRRHTPRNSGQAGAR